MCQHGYMLSKRIVGVLGAAVCIPAGAAVATPTASADACPDVEVIFARGTGAPAGLGWLGDAFVERLRAEVDDRSVAAYAVNYPASFDFDTSAPAGAADAAARVQYMADNCPDTKLVLGGNSQGAGVIDLITVDPGPLGRFTPTPMPAHLAGQVAAVAVFGNPLRDIRGGGPLPELSGLYGAKTIDLCGLNDPFCSDGFNFVAHFSYIENGMVDQAVDFVAARVR